MDAYTQLAGEFDLPLRMASQAPWKRTASRCCATSSGKGPRLTDYFIHGELPQEKNGVKQILGASSKT